MWRGTASALGNVATRCGRAAVLLLAAIGFVASPAFAREPLEERLAQGWRWREIPPPAGASRIVGVAPGGQDGLLAISRRQIDAFDGYAWRPVLQSLDPALQPRRFVERTAGGLIAFDGTRLESIDLNGRRRTLLVSERFDQVMRRAHWPTGARNLLSVDGRLIEASLDGIEDRAPAPPAPLVAGDIDMQGRIWVSTAEGLFVYDGTWKPVRTNMGPRAHLSFAHVRCVDGQVWFLTSVASGHDTSLVTTSPDEPALVSDRIRGPVWAAQKIEGQGLICGAGASGLRVLRGGTWREVALPIDANEQIVAVAHLTTGHLACATVSGRIFTCDLVSNRWRRHMPPGESEYCDVLDLRPASAGGLWVATAGGIHRFHEGEFTQSLRSAGDVPLRVITSSFEDARGHLWVVSGSDFAGALRYDGSTWHRHVEPEGLGNYCVHAIRPGRDGALWFLLLSPPGVFPGGGGAVQWRDGVWRRFGTDDGLPSNRCYDFATMANGREYVATGQGLARFDGKRFQPVEGMTGFAAKRLHAAPDGTLWVAQSHHPDSTRRDGDQVIQSKLLFGRGASLDLAQDGRGRLWLTAATGLYVSHDGFEHEVTREPGAPVHTFWPIHIDDDGALWLGGSGKGLVRFTPDDAHPPRLDAVEALFDEAQAVTTIRWRATDFWSVTPADSLRYRWRIDDGPWSAHTNDQEVVLAGLSSAAHQVEVRAYDLQGNQSAETGIVTFEIPSPWFARLPFLIAAALVLTGLGTGLFLVGRQRRAKRLARESASRYARALLQRANVLLASADERGDILYVSPRFLEDFSPHSLEEMHSDPTRLLARIHPDDAEAATEYLRTQGQRGTQAGEFRVQRMDGSYRWLLVTTARRERTEATVAGWDFVGADITDVKRAQEEHALMERQIRHTQKLESLGVLAGGIAHDFNNLLTSILANANMAQARADGPRMREHLRQIETGASQAAALTKQLLAYSGRGRFVVEPIELSALVEEMANLLEASISKTSSLHHDLAPGLPATMADATQIRQIVMNLITNASDALKGEPGTVQITTGVQEADAAFLAQTYFADDVAPGRFVFVEVSDTGVGMDEEAQARLFDPFYTTKETGRGLGLSAVLGIVRGHHGTLQVRSEAGRGTSFKILLPASSEPVAAAPPVPEPSAWKAEGTVLIVDDEVAVRAVVEAMLQMAGFDTLHATDGIEGVRQFEEHRDEIVLVLLDLTMPNMDGKTALRHLRQIDPDVRTVMMSGFDAQDMTSRIDGEQPTGFVQKPFRPAELMEKIEQALA